MLRTDLEATDDVDVDQLAKIIAALSDKEVAVVAGPSDDGRPLILVTNNVPADHCDRVALRPRRRRRILVLSLVAHSPPAALVWRVIAAGAGDLLHWDSRGEAAATIAARLSRWQEVDRLVENAAMMHGVIGRSASFRASLEMLVEAAHFTDDPILICGETGTGKEIAARLVHALDPKRCRRPLTLVDGGAIVPTLAGSEFFGHERGAFTGAASARDGAFAAADGSVMFLDEVGELPPDIQVQLLRVLQDKRFKRVGGDTWRRTDFRLITATNRDLRAEVDAGRFRRDLYYRLAVWTVELPPLRERTEDVLPLAEHFLGAGLGATDRPVLSKPVRSYLLDRTYPGNIRDLQKLCRQMHGRHVGGPIYTVGDLPVPPALGNSGYGVREPCPFEEGVRRALEAGKSLKEVTAAAAETAIRLALEEANMSITEASHRLHVTPRALQLRRRQQAAEERTDLSLAADENVRGSPSPDEPIDGWGWRLT